jgi:hypothetical protein
MCRLTRLGILMRRVGGTIAVAMLGLLFIVSAAQGETWRVPSQTPQLTQIPIPTSPHLTAGPAVATPLSGTPITLDLGTYSEMIVDQNDQRLFVVGTISGHTRLIALSFSGATLGTIDATGDSGTAALVGSTLYVPDCAGDAATPYDAATLEPGTGFAMGGAQSGYCDLAYSGGRLWTADSATSGLRSISLDAPHTVTHYGALSVYFPAFSTTATKPNTLISWTGDNSPPTISVDRHERRFAGGDCAAGDHRCSARPASDQRR